MTKPLAGRAGARIVGTVGGIAHRPRLMQGNRTMGAKG